VGQTPVGLTRREHDPHRQATHLPVIMPPPTTGGGNGSIAGHARSVNSPRPTTTEKYQTC